MDMKSEKANYAGDSHWYYENKCYIWYFKIALDHYAVGRQIAINSKVQFWTEMATIQSISVQVTAVLSSFLISVLWTLLKIH